MIRALFLEETSLWCWAWQSTLFVAIGLVGSFLLRHRPARACQTLFLALVAAVIVPAISVLVAHLGLGLLAPEPMAYEPQVSYDVVAIDYEAPEAIPLIAPRAEMEPVELQADAAPAPVQIASSGAGLPWRSILLYGWLIAAFALLGRLLIALVGGVRLLRRSKPHHNERIRRAMECAQARLGVTKDLRVCSGADVRSPMIWCWSRPPVLLVPEDLDGSVDWVDVICHELAHWRRRDHLTGLIAELAVCVLPWNPLLWWARKRIVRLSEQACDDWVLAGGRAGTDYAQSLLNLSPKAQMAFLPTMIGKEKPMKERIYRIVKSKCGNPRIGVRWALAMTVIAATLTVGVAFAQRRPAPEEPDRRARAERKADLREKAHQMEEQIGENEAKLHALEETGKGDSDEAQNLRAELREMREGRERLEQELRGPEAGPREREVRTREGQEQRREILRRLEELGRETELQLRRLEEQPGRREEANALSGKMRELNEQMRQVRRELGRQLEERGRREPQREGRERPEIDRRIEELTRHLDELRMDSADKERALHELEERGRGETEDANALRRKLGEVHDQIRAAEQKLANTERERGPMREGRGRAEGGPSPEAMAREQEKLGDRARQIELELRELGGEHPERAEQLHRELDEIHARMEKIEREQGRVERPRPGLDDLYQQRQGLQARLGEIERALGELNDQGKGESEKARNLNRERREIQKQLDVNDRELRNVGRERPQEPERPDLERQVQELRMQVNGVNEQMGEMRELLKRLLERERPAQGEPK